MPLLYVTGGQETTSPIAELSNSLPQLPSLPSKRISHGQNYRSAISKFHTIDAQYDLAQAKRSSLSLGWLSMQPSFKHKKVNKWKLLF